MTLIYKFIRDKVFLSLLFILVLEAFFYFYFNKDVLVLFVYPTIGAIIGYITNVIAVWMIFNPKKPLFGYESLQGLIPKSHKRIAERISSVVERELINPQFMKDYLKKNASVIQKRLEKTVKDYISQNDITIKNFIGERFFNKLKFGIITFYQNNVNFLAKFIYQFLTTQLEKFLKGNFSSAQLKSLNIKLEEFIVKKLKEIAYKIVNDVKERSLSEFINKKRLEQEIKKFLHGLDEETLKKFYTTLATKRLYDIYPKVDETFNWIINFLSEKLKEENFKKNLARIIADALKKSGFSGVVITIVDVFFDVENYVYKKLEEISEKIENDPQFVEMIYVKVNEFFQKPLYTYISKEDFLMISKKLINLLGNNAHLFVEKIASKKIKEIFYFVDEDTIPKFVFNLANKINFEEITEGFYNFIQKNENLLISWLEETLISQEIINVLDKLLEKLGNYQFNNEIKRLIEDKEALEHIFLKLEPGLDWLVKNVEVKKIVKEKIEGFSVERLEELFFNMMDKEFRYIEKLGIPIGFGIGLVQLIFR